MSLCLGWVAGLSVYPYPTRDYLTARKTPCKYPPVMRILSLKETNQCKPLSPVSAMYSWQSTSVFTIFATSSSRPRTTWLPSTKP